MSIPKSRNPDDYQNSRSTAAVMLKEFAARSHVGFHSHERAQLVYASQGIFELSTRDRWWLVPPRFGIWIPAGTEHKMQAKTNVVLNTLYINTEQWQKNFPMVPRNVATSNLLHELLIRASTLPIEYDSGSIEYKIMDLLVEELEWADSISLPFPKPETDKRIRHLCRLVIEHPENNYSLEELAGEVGATQRTLTRLFKTELNTTFGLWRQQLRIMNAIPLLLAGKSVGQVSHEVGYGSQSAFTAMFRRLMGMTPSAYLRCLGSAGDQ